MNTPTGWKRKLILLFKSEKLLGAKQIMNDFDSKKFEAMKTRFIGPIEDIDKSNTSNIVQPIDNGYEPKKIKNLDAHFERLQREFVGQSELCFYHATLVVLLRRGYRPFETFKKFELLWQTETEYLLQHLSSRWLISACDTFIDYSANPLRQAILMNAVSMVNTLKIYETNLDLLNCQSKPDISKVHKHTIQHQLLYDGLTYFRISADDTLKKMLIRYQNFEKLDPFAYQLLMAIFARLQTIPSGFATIKNLHHDAKTQWW